jgi:hypothetical protein
LSEASLRRAELLPQSFAAKADFAQAVFSL